MSPPRTPQALILPYPAQGHVIPLMELSYCLIERGFRITFINTEFNHERVYAAMLLDQAKFTDEIRFVTIPDGLGPEEDRNDFGRLTESMMKVMPSSLEELMRNINGAESTCFIADVCMAWGFEIAERVGIRAAGFWPAATGTLAVLFRIPELIRDGVIDEDGVPIKKEVIQLSPGVPLMDASYVPWNNFHDANTREIFFKYLRTNSQAFSKAEMIICNSFEELEKPIFTEMPNILPIGPLLTSFKSREESNLCQFWHKDKQCISWLNKRQAGSVIYVAFGSTTIFNNKQFQELALGLELTGRPFLWVVRPDLTNKLNNCTYPLGFEDRIAGRGRIVDWSPQDKVLKHPAIACFISHCGWNSTIEGIANGVPFICWPYFGDQLFNKYCISNVWKIGLSLALDENGLISKEDVCSKVEELLKDKDIMAKSQALKNFAQVSVMEGGSSFENLNKFVDFIRKI